MTFGEQHHQVLHVHDLPQVYAKPSSQSLLEVLDLLKKSPSTFTTSPTSLNRGPSIDPAGVPRYLTSIVSSSLQWLDSDDVREEIWNAASARLSERSGRNAAPSMTRVFEINDNLSIRLHEPSLTEDNLGLKTWTSSLLLSRRLSLMRKSIPESVDRVLELGSGTGLVGITAAHVWNVNVLLTDLPEIVPNLEQNVLLNADTLQDPSRLSARVLDWNDASDVPGAPAEMYDVILAADPIYSSEHPRMLVETVGRWLSRSQHARFILELPLRPGYEKDRADLRSRLKAANMEIVEEGTEVGYDDWEGANGLPAEVECWWSIWKPML